jgi:hypothetical protein
MISKILIIYDLACVTRDQLWLLVFATELAESMVLLCVNLANIK